MSEDYLAYKKNKLKEQAEEKEKKISKKRAGIIFLATFAICFLLVINLIIRYSAKIDIEYGRAIKTNDGLPDMDGPFVRGSNPISDFIDDKKSQIDSRLKIIHLEETAPSESRVLGANKDRVLDIDHYKKLMEEEVQKETETLKATPKTVETPKPAPPPKVIVSKVLIGRYNSFDEARLAQNQLKEDNGAITFIRKMGEIYALQVGLYADETAAQNIANKYQESGYSVWILQD